MSYWVNGLELYGGKAVIKMGLDFGINKVRRGENISDEVCYGRNCHTVKRLIIPRLKSYDSDTCTAKLSLQDLNKILQILVDETKEYNLNDVNSLNDDLYKLYRFAGELAISIGNDICDNYWDEAEYDYELYDSY